MNTNTSNSPEEWITASLLNFICNNAENISVIILATVFFTWLLGIIIISALLPNDYKPIHEESNRKRYRQQSINN